MTPEALLRLKEHHRSLEASIASERQKAPYKQNLVRLKHYEEIAGPLGEVIEQYELIEYLRQEEGDSLEILCDNPDPKIELLNYNAVVFNGDSTNYEDKRFFGMSLVEALRNAARFKLAATS